MLRTNSLWKSLIDTKISLLGDVTTHLIMRGRDTSCTCIVDEYVYLTKQLPGLLSGCSGSLGVSEVNWENPGCGKVNS